MAEQSMFWPTTGTGDGISGGYTADRLASIWKSVLGNGVLKYLNDLEVTGTGTTSLAVNTGSAIINGYLYENTSSATITTSTLGSATYGLYVIANEGTTALTVNRSVAGTTVAAKAVRLALNSTAPTQPYIKIATVGVTAGAITGITPQNGRWAISRSASVDNLATINQGLLGDTLSVLNNTTTPVTALYTQDSDFISINGTTGVVTVKQSGTYAIYVTVTWDTNTTNRRRITVATASVQYLASAIIHTTAQEMQSFTIAPYLEGDTFTVDLWQDSGSTRIVSGTIVRIVKL